jgi:NAD(P)H-hydrate epimerase
MSFESLEMLKRYELLNGVLEQFSADSIGIEEYLSTCGVIIDAIFGIGLNAGLDGDALFAAQMINNSEAFVIAADIPSGVMADTGAIPTSAVKANLTITFSLAKNGQYINPGSTNCGEVRIHNIGIPSDLIDGAVSNVFAVLSEDISLPDRKPGSHKGDYGRCYIVSGSVGFSGAPVLCAQAASKMGAGLVFLGVPDRIYNIVAGKLLEEMPFPLPNDKAGQLTANATSEILRRISDCDVCLIGPGLGLSDEISELVRSILSMSDIPVVLDADGINSLAGNTSILNKVKGPLVLTPHHGEFVRLVGHVPSGERLRSARSFAKQHNCYLVLKGHRTITAMPDGTAFINTTGGPAMAKGGSGDVLAGMITSLIGQRIPIKDAILTAVFLHGTAGDLCAEEMSDYSVCAGDIINMIPNAIKSII